MATIIGLLGAAGSGKSEVAKHLVRQHGFVRHRYADGVKSMLRAIGLTGAQVDGAEKEDPIPLLGGKSYRDAATSLGTGWGRNMMDEGLWVRALELKIMQAFLEDANVCVVVDDVRYANEAALIRQLGGHLIKVRRPETEPRWNWFQRLLVRLGLCRLLGVHTSEVQWFLYDDVDFEIYNVRDLGTLQTQASGLLSLLQKERRDVRTHLVE